MQTYHLRAAAGHVRRPLIHQMKALLELIRPRVTPFYGRLHSGASASSATAHQAGLNARRETMREGLLFRIPALPFGRPLARIPPGLVYKALPMYNRPYTL